MATAAGSTAREYKIVGIISSAHALSHFYFLVLPPILPLLKAEFQVSYAALGLLMTGYGLAAGVIQTPVGFIVDRIGGRPSLAAGLFAQAGCIALMGLATDYWQLLVLYILAGMANTVYHPADYVIMTASIAKDRLGRAFAIHLFSGNLGWAVTPAIMVGLTALFDDWRWAFLITGGVGMALAVLVWSQSKLLDDDIHQRNARLENQEQAERGATPAEDDVKAGIKLLFTLPIFMCFLFFVSLTLGFTGIRGFFVVAMDVMYAMPLVTANLVLSGFLLGSAIGILAGGFLADRIGPQIGTAIVTLVAAGVLLVLIGSVALPVMVLIGVMTTSGFLQGILLPTRDLLVRAATPDGSMGKVRGFLSSGTMLASGVVPVLFGWILDIGNPNWVFWVSGFFITGALFSFITARQGSSRGQEAVRESDTK